MSNTSILEFTGAMDARAFGQMVRAQRKAQGLRQQDLADAAGVGRRYVVEMERGKPTLQIGQALRIARFLDIIPVIVPTQNTMKEADLPEITPDNSLELE